MIKKILITGILAGMAFAGITVEEKIEVYKIPYNKVGTINDIEKTGNLEEKKVIKKPFNGIDKKDVIIYFKKNNLNDEEKLKILINLLEDYAKKHNILNKDATIKVIKILKNLHN